MKSLNLKDKAIAGMLWNATEKFSIQISVFIIGVILARILTPADFGIIGMLSVFIMLSQVFVDSGLGSGLIQKQNRKNIDFSTVFVFNLIVSVVIYFILYFVAPAIADFYDMPQLTILTRVLSLNIVIISFAIIQRSKLTIKLDFKSLAKANVISTVIGGVVAIYLAYNGFGVWALVVQNLTKALITVILLWILSDWRISIKFSSQSFNVLFNYGYKLLISKLYATGLDESVKLIIAKSYSTSDLGFFTRAKQFPNLVSDTIANILQQVTFPILSTLQDDSERLISVYRRIIKITGFFIFPAMTLLALLADPIIRLLLTDKWAPAIEYLQWLSFSRIFYPMSLLNMNILKVVGRSDLFLKVDLLKAPVFIIILLITVPLGIKAMVIGYVINSWISYIINSYMPGRLFNYGLYKQLKDIYTFVLITAIMAIAVYFVKGFFDNLFLKLIIGGITGVISYLFLAYLFKINELKEITSLFSRAKK